MIVPLLVVGGLLVGALLFGKKGEQPSGQTGEELDAAEGTQWQLTYGTSRQISDLDLTMIQRAMSGPSGIPGSVIQGAAISGPQEFKVNMSFQQPYKPAIGAVGVLGSSPNDAITIQLIAANKVS